MGGLGALLLAGVFLLAGGALAWEPQQSYDLSWWTVDGGGGSSAVIYHVYLPPVRC